MHGGYECGSRNHGDDKILDFAVACDLIIANICLEKRDECLITFKSGTNKPIFFFTMKFDKLACKDKLYHEK